jgi:hypothetical protein
MWEYCRKFWFLRPNPSAMRNTYAGVHQGQL